MLVSSRSFEEYVAFFALTESDLTGRVLDCSAGASGFTAEANSRGGNVTAADPAYADVNGLRTVVEAGFHDGSRILDAHADSFVWHWYGTPERRRELRDSAAREFLDDVAANPQTYVAAALPHLPFAERTFDLALCSHLLFTWADTFDEDWHRAAILELARVASEVRIFPTVQQGAGVPVEFLPRLVDDLRAGGLEVEYREVPYEFQRGAHQMLVVAAS